MADARKITSGTLIAAPSYDMDEHFLWTPDYGLRIDKYYNAPTYW